MYLVADRESAPIESVDQLVEYFRAAGKPRAEWRIGTEHEMPGVYTGAAELGAAPPYEGDRGIGAVFAGYVRDGWQPVREGDHLIALTCKDSQVTFEPGGQLELAVKPLERAAELKSMLEQNLKRVAAISKPMGIAWLDIGLRPFGQLADVPWMPKSRYAIMREYLPGRGRLAHEMMLRTCTVQVNLDYADAADALAKMRCTMSTTSLLTALYANSPLVDGELTDYQSYRARIWLETDPDRCGLLPFVFEDGDLFRNYAEWALDVPLFFVHRGGYVPAGGMTFRRFLREGWQGSRATIDDWALHLSTLFPEMRLKQYLEVRGCDAGSVGMITALGVLARGLLYDDSAMRAATDLTGGLDFAARLELRRVVPREGLRARVGTRTVGDLTRELVAIARDAIARTAPEELGFLAPLEQIVAEQRTGADRVADLWRAAAGDRAELIRKLAYPGLTGGL